MRLDDLLIARNLAENKKEAFIVVTEGRVLVNGQKAISGAQMVSADARIDLRQSRLYVGRGAEKLAAALHAFAISVKGGTALDIGAATGGFTDVLLQNGATRVYAVDTARGKLDLKLRQDQRVCVMEQTDIRSAPEIPEKIDIVVIDVSLIPLRDILSHTMQYLKTGGSVVALLKPQYEARDKKMLHHGIVVNADDREAILNEFLAHVRVAGWQVEDWIESPIRGSKGNIEYLIHLTLLTS